MSRMSFAFEGTSVGLFIWETNGVGNTIKPGSVTTYIDERSEVQHGELRNAWVSPDRSVTMLQVSTRIIKESMRVQRQ